MKSSTLVQLSKNSSLFQQDIGENVGVLLVGGLHNMGVNVGRCADLCVTQPLGDRYTVHAVEVKHRGHGVPLRYNYDKPEKPRISRAFGYLARLFILFQTEKSSREVVIS